MLAPESLSLKIIQVQSVGREAHTTCNGIFNAQELELHLLVVPGDTELLS